MNKTIETMLKDFLSQFNIIDSSQLPKSRLAEFVGKAQDYSHKVDCSIADISDNDHPRPANTIVPTYDEAHKKMREMRLLLTEEIVAIKRYNPKTTTTILT